MTRAVVTINTPADRDQIARWAKNVEPGTVVEFRKKSRSTEQNAKLWAMLAEVSEQVIWYGQKLDADDWKDLFTAALRNARVVPGIDKGSYVPLGMRTSQMTIAEMSDLIELIHAFGADPEHPVKFKDSDTGPSVPSSGAGEDEAGYANSSSQTVDQSASDQTATAEPAELTHAPEAAAGSPSLPPEEQPLSAVDRSLLIECCAKFMELARRDDLEPQGRRDALVKAKEAWKAEIRTELHPKMASMFLSADAIIRGKAAREHAIAEFAGWLGCRPDEIGGGNG